MKRFVRSFTAAIMATTMVLGGTSVAQAQSGTIHPGSTYIVSGKNVKCTIALTGMADDGTTPLALTAGHCLQGGTGVTANGVSGTIIHAVDEGEGGYDYGVIAFPQGTRISSLTIPDGLTSGSVDAADVVGVLGAVGVPQATLSAIKDGGTSGRQPQLILSTSGVSVNYVGLRQPGDSGAPVVDLNGNIFAIHNRESFGNIVSYGTSVSAAIENFNGLGLGGFTAELSRGEDIVTPTQSMEGVSGSLEVAGSSGSSEGSLGSALDGTAEGDLEQSIEGNENLFLGLMGAIGVFGVIIAILDTFSKQGLITLPR